MFCPLEGALRGRFVASVGSKAWTTADMDTYADAVSVRVAKEDDGWKFRTVQTKN
jgi:hypothetical protein